MIAVIVIVNFIVRFLTSTSNIRIISFICSYNITIVVFREWRFIIRKNFAIVAIIVIIIIIITVIIINAVKNITRIIIFRDIGRTLTSYH